MFTLDTGNTAWMITATALVLLMTPGLAFFYGGMVRAKSVLNMMMMSFISIGTVGLSSGWSTDTASRLVRHAGGLVGNPSGLVGLNGVEDGAGAGCRGWRSVPRDGGLPGDLRDHHGRADLRFDRGPHEVLRVDDLHGAVGHARLHPHRARRVGWRPARLASRPPRRSTSPVEPLCTSTPVPLASRSRCCSALRKGFGKEPFKPHNLPFVMLGAALLWFGWFGFNAGSEFGADATAGRAFLNTTVAPGQSRCSAGCSLSGSVTASPPRSVPLPASSPVLSPSRPPRLRSTRGAPSPSASSPVSCVRLAVGSSTSSAMTTRSTSSVSTSSAASSAPC